MNHTVISNINEIYEIMEDYEDLKNDFEDSTEEEEKLEEVKNEIKNLLSKIFKDINKDIKFEEEDANELQKFVIRLPEIKEYCKTYSDFIETRLKEILTKLNESTPIIETIQTEEIVKSLKRTDKDLIKKVNVLNSAKYVFKIVETQDKHIKNNIALNFNNPQCDIVNSTLKNKNNTYSLDRYGLVIRKNSFNKSKDPFGWKYDQKTHEPIHYYVKPENNTYEQNINAVLSYQYNSNKKLFQSGVIYKIYSIYYPERLEKFVNKEGLDVKK
jgi:DNA repair exonuclease SbcCD ATPase subunit